MTKGKRLRLWLARFVMYQWRKMSLYSAIAWSWLTHNGGNGNDGPEDLNEYLKEDD